MIEPYDPSILLLGMIKSPPSAQVRILLPSHQEEYTKGPYVGPVTTGKRSEEHLMLLGRRR
jgi:hypothetical protein